MLVGPVPEQRENGGVIECRRRGKPAGLPRILHEGEISASQGNDTSGGLHATGGKKGRQKNEKTKGEKGAAYFCLVRYSVTLLGERGERSIILLLKGTWDTGFRQTVPDIRHGENQGSRILGNQTRRTETGEEKSNTDGD